MVRKLSGFTVTFTAKRQPVGGWFAYPRVVRDRLDYTADVLSSAFPSQRTFFEGITREDAENNATSILRPLLEELDKRLSQKK